MSKLREIFYLLVCTQRNDSFCVLFMYKPKKISPQLIVPQNWSRISPSSPLNFSDKLVKISKVKIETTAGTKMFATVFCTKFRSRLRLKYLFLCSSIGTKYGGELRDFIFSNSGKLEIVTFHPRASSSAGLDITFLLHQTLSWITPANVKLLWQK